MQLHIHIDVQCQDSGGILFRELLDKDLPREYLRLMLNMYTNHVTRVSWNGICSALFLAKNGVKQGGMINPVLFCIYEGRSINKLQNGAIPLILRIGKIQNICFVGNLILKIHRIFLMMTSLL